VPILSDGATGATLRLRSLFESFNDQILAAADAAEAGVSRGRQARARGVALDKVTLIVESWRPFRRLFASCSAPAPGPE
jgi:hypothetical protein